MEGFGIGNLSSYDSKMFLIDDFFILMSIFRVILNSFIVVS